MKKILLMLAIAAVVTVGCKRRESHLELSYPSYEGETVELISFADSTVLQTGMVQDGKLIFDNGELLNKGPLLVQVVIDGRVKGFAVIEEGVAVLSDTMSVASGTPLNDLFVKQIKEMDSVENLNDMIAYSDFAKRKYKENSDNVLGEYFGLEYFKYGEPKEVLAAIKAAPESYRESKKVKRYERYATLRAKTAVGEPYADFAASQKDGRVVKLSDYVKPGEYTLVDFWASWCPYCIKELPELKELYGKYNGKGLNIVGVAVRDEVSDTEESVKKHGITWSVIKNAQKIPYDVYGFSGIPHLVLIGPDGKIVARGESAKQTAERLAKIFKE
ncbi:MAG: TlpA family protein disulfide reductase [Prevotella sp.]|nr:TlpA family protein disulfide reductase [Bacteroides sp.]MCM1366785.1 TlpA family protein disulfide reductase [Prevotella sp.]MCM1436452.1 TlpA family protein disulfide reductase [Prevotella sp.]